MTYASIILLVLRIVNALISAAREKGWITEGQNREIARAASEILKKVEVAKQIDKNIDTLSPAAVDDLLRDDYRVDDRDKGKPTS